jgi:hypothetical protein
MLIMGEVAGKSLSPPNNYHLVENLIFFSKKFCFFNLKKSFLLGFYSM